MGEKNIPSEKLRCNECHSELDLDAETGELTCRKCGKVAGKEMVTGPEWRDFGDEESQKRDRAGAPPSILVPGKGFPTVISASKRDALGKDLSPGISEQMLRLSKIQKWSIYPEKSLNLAIKILRRASNNLFLPAGTTEMAAKTLEEAIAFGLARGRKIEALVGACIYQACRKSGTSRNYRQIAQELQITKKEVQTADRLIRRFLHKQVPLLPIETLIPQFGEILEIHPKVVIFGIAIIREISSTPSGRIMLSGKDPRSWVAPGLYIACLISGTYKTQETIADAIGTTEVTLRNRLKDLVKSIDITMEI